MVLAFLILPNTYFKNIWTNTSPVMIVSPNHIRVFFSPGSVNALQWSEDNLLALATTSHVHIFVWVFSSHFVYNYQYFKFPPSTDLKRGLIVIPSYIAKGLEFDATIIYTEKNNAYEYSERYLYYVACTWSQHHLIIYNQKKLV